MENWLRPHFLYKFVILGSYELKQLSDAVDMVKDSVNTLNEFEHDIRDEFVAAPKSLNGTHGYVSSKSHTSLELTVWSLQRLRNTLHENNYSSANMLSMMTLSVEHFHSTTHMKQTMLSPLQYAMSFMTSIKESLKREFPWAAYYFTSTKGSWYPPSESSTNYIKVSKSLPSKLYSKSGTRKKVEEEEMRQWAQTYTKGVRQRSVRQETTMDKSGTLPHYLYSVDICKQAAKTKRYVDEENQIEETKTTAVEPILDDDEPNHADDSIIPDEQSDKFSSEEDDVEESHDAVDVGDQALFLIGRTSRFGRAIKISKRFFS